tara:strand:+ start:3230 stop:3682 length:453 start_codon:yes stop_codon:yes gene_type:complete
MPLLKRLGRVTQLNGVADLLINADGDDRTYQLQQGDSGKVFFVEQDDDEIAIYLPMAENAGAGWHINIIVKAVNSADIIVYNHASETANNIHAIIYALTSDYGVSSSDIVRPSIVLGNDTKIGDRLEIFCDGTLFYCYGWSVTDAAMAFP